ncbi:MAG: iron-containing alcohol dehydrogenase [Flavobacteriaceae bacterium]
MRSGRYDYPRMNNVRYGQRWTEALRDEVARLDSERVFVVASGSLLEAAPLAHDLARALGNRFAGVESGVRAHSPSEDVVRLAGQARKAKADLLVAIGGSSVTDAVKVMRIAMEAGVETPAALSGYRNTSGSPARRLSLPLPCVAIPTTLSGAEFTALAGITNLDLGVKESYRHPDLAPASVILDPALTVHTPEVLWLSSGVRAVDHAIEDICSINGNPFSDAASIHALRLLLPSLKRTKADPADLDARLDSMIGAWLSLVGTQGGVDKGVSHAIGHILGGSAGVPHGLTSCIILPHALQWNAAVNADRQRIASEAMGAPDTPAGEIVARLIADLGLPHRLQDVGITYDDLDRLAELTMRDRWVPTNPRRIAGASDVREILEMAWQAV